MYTIAGDAYATLSLTRKNVSVLISGESGAGKTEATKQVLQYLSEVAGSATGVEQKVLSANPVLEAFGNAKTLRNNNSSRFGKFMEVHFDRGSKICGCRCVGRYTVDESSGWAQWMGAMAGCSVTQSPRVRFAARICGRIQPKQGSPPPVVVYPLFGTLPLHYICPLSPSLPVSPRLFSMAVHRTTS